jgi:hypothetical protein
VSLYIPKVSESCFVWAAPPLRTGAIIKNRKETYSRQLSVCWESNLTRVKGEVRVDPRAISIIYNWDGQTYCPRTDCFKLDAAQPYNTGYQLTYRFFAQILTPIGAQTLLIYLYTWLAYYILLQPWLVLCN